MLTMLFFFSLLKALDLLVNFKKVEKLQFKIACLGIDIDAKNGILAVPDKKMEKICLLCKRVHQETNY